MKRGALFEGPAGGCKRWRPTGFISQPALHLEVPLAGELLAERPPGSLTSVGADSEISVLVSLPNSVAKYSDSSH